MQYQVSLALCSAALISAVASFNPSQDSCGPNEHVYLSHSSDSAGCDFQTKDAHTAIYQCGVSSAIKYNFKQNTISLASISSEAGAFTIHGACYEADNQVAHIDLHMPVSQGFQRSHTYKGLNRVCDLGKANKPPVLKFTYYRLRPEELFDCGHNPINPIS